MLTTPEAWHPIATTDRRDGTVGADGIKRTIGRCAAWTQVVSQSGGPINCGHHHPLAMAPTGLDWNSRNTGAGVASWWNMPCAFPALRLTASYDATQVSHAIQNWIQDKQLWSSGFATDSSPHSPSSYFARPHTKKWTGGFQADRSLSSRNCVANPPIPGLKHCFSRSGCRAHILGLVAQEQDPLVL
jgi:hypothetical protein